MISLCCLVGLVIYANFAGCDPLTHPDPSKRISSPNQLVGNFVLNNLDHLPGTAGIFLASIFCGSLSSVSSYLNSQAAIIWHDLLLPHKYFAQFDDAKSLTTNKLLVLLCGLIGSGLAFFIATAGGNIMQISTSLNGAFNSPIMGLFLLGMLFSISTPRGVISGTIAGFFAALWISMGAYITKPVYPMLNVTTEFCPNATDFPPLPVKNQTVVMAADLTGINKFYSLSYMWYMPFGILVTIVVGLVASFIDGFFTKKFYDKAEIKEYIYVDLCWFCGPKSKSKRKSKSHKRERKFSSNNNDMDVDIDRL
jgi:Na+/proline symporter